MKKSVVLILVVLAVLAMATIASAERHVITLKLGLNSSGLEVEKINNSGLGFYFSETSTSYWDYATLFGIRKHTKVAEPHVYFGAALGITYIWPTVDGHVGMELQPAFLPDFLKARVEGGASYTLRPRYYDHSNMLFRLGVGVSYDFDWTIFSDLF